MIANPVDRLLGLVRALRTGNLHVRIVNWTSGHRLVSSHLEEVSGQMLQKCGPSDRSRTTNPAKNRYRRAPGFEVMDTPAPSEPAPGNPIHLFLIFARHGAAERLLPQSPTLLRSQEETRSNALVRAGGSRASRRNVFDLCWDRSGGRGACRQVGRDVRASSGPRRIAGRAPGCFGRTEMASEQPGLLDSCVLADPGRCRRARGWLGTGDRGRGHALRRARLSSRSDIPSGSVSHHSTSVSSVWPG